MRSCGLRAAARARPDGRLRHRRAHRPERRVAGDAAPRRGPPRERAPAAAARVCAAAWSKCHPWQCPSSAPVPPQGAPGGSDQLGTPRARLSWAPRHCLGCSS
eukprot:scaffold19817_cov64-Phaeocystis_antarctica.AAC.3